MPDIRSTTTLSNEQLELLTQLRVGQSWRMDDRRSIIRQARRIQARARLIRDDYLANGRHPHAHVLWQLRWWLEALIYNIRVLRAEEEAARELEAEIWSNIG